MGKTKGGQVRKVIDIIQKVTLFLMK